MMQRIKPARDVQDLEGVIGAGYSQAFTPLPKDKPVRSFSFLVLVLQLRHLLVPLALGFFRLSEPTGELYLTTFL